MGLYLSGFDPSVPTSSVISTIAQSATSVVIAPANGSRRWLSVYNDGTKTLYLAYAATATTSAYTVQVPKGGLWEGQEDGYSGIVSGIWAGAGGGNALVTEVS